MDGLGGRFRREGQFRQRRTGVWGRSLAAANRPDVIVAVVWCLLLVRRAVGGRVVGCRQTHSLTAQYLDNLDPAKNWQQ